VSSNDPEAVVKLKGKLELLEQQRETIKAREHSAWELSNLGATIRSTKQRIEELKRTATLKPNADIRGQGFIVREDVKDNRIHVVFDERPPRETCQVMRQNGFKWSPSRGAWVRMLNNNGRHAAEYVIMTLAKED